MQYECCGNQFSNLITYMRHLKYHGHNINLQVKCNECGQTCGSWDAFRKHNSRWHKENTTLNQYDDDIYDDDIYSVIDDLVLQDTLEDSEMLENNEPVETCSDSDDFDIYGQYMLEFSYQHKLPEKSINTLNKNTENLIRTLLLSSKVRNYVSIVIKVEICILKLTLCFFVDKLFEPRKKR
jgi:hypothetical protein